MHLVIRLTEDPVRLFSADEDSTGFAVGTAIVAGPRCRYHIKDVSRAAHVVGVELHPAASSGLFGTPADSLAHVHADLNTFWSRAFTSELRERLITAATPQSKLDLMEEALRARLSRVHGVHPAVAVALERLHVNTRIEQVVRESGYSHRTVATQFRRAMGLSPKEYSRVRRLLRLLPHIGTRSWTDLALDAGFSDQAHFVREFKAFTGVTPTYYRRTRPDRPHHVRILQDADVARR